MADAVIISTARTPIGKAFRGAFNMTHGAVLGGHVVKHAVERAGVDPGEIEDVVMGCAMPERATGQNIARLSAIRAGLPVTVPGVTVNRFCSSGLQTIAFAAQRIITGEVDVIAAYSSDGQIAQYDLVLLEDPKRSLPPYDAVILLAPGRADDRELTNALTPLLGAVTVERMRKANLMVSGSPGTTQTSPAEAARWLSSAIISQR